ncbi:CBS domain-containing protein [bacterium]|nr:CBS domain-containing protein [bacterium]
MICPDCGYDNYAGEEVCERCLHDLTQADTTPVPKNEIHRSIIEDPMSSLKTVPHATCGPRDPIAKAIESMKSHRVGCCIVEEKGEAVGIFTERDVLMKVIGRNIDPARTQVQTLMTAPVEGVKQTDNLALALNKMSIGGYRHVPILDAGGRVSGVVSVRTILRHLVNQLS